LIEPLETLALAHGNTGEETSHCYLQYLVVLVTQIYHDSPAALSNLQLLHLKSFISLFTCSPAPKWHADLLQILGMMCVYKARATSQESGGQSDIASARGSLLLSAQMGGTANSRRSADYLGIPNNQKHIMGLLESMDIFSMFPRTKMSDPDNMVILFQKGGGVLEWQALHDALAVK